MNVLTMETNSPLKPSIQEVLGEKEGYKMSYSPVQRVLKALYNNHQKNQNLKNCNLVGLPFSEKGFFSDLGKGALGFSLELLSLMELVARVVIAIFTYTSAGLISIFNTNTSKKLLSFANTLLKQGVLHFTAPFMAIDDHIPLPHDDKMGSPKETTGELQSNHPTASSSNEVMEINKKAVQAMFLHAEDTHTLDHDDGSSTSLSDSARSCAKSLPSFASTSVDDEEEGDFVKGNEAVNRFNNINLEEVITARKALEFFKFNSEVEFSFYKGEAGYIGFRMGGKDFLIEAKEGRDLAQLRIAFDERYGQAKKSEKRASIPKYFRKMLSRIRS